jgi:hypothetical protein
LCKTISPENNQSCTKKTPIWNLVYNQLKENIPVNTDIENKSQLTSNPSTPAAGLPNPATPAAGWPTPTYTPCGWTYTPECTITVDWHKLKLTGEFKWFWTNWCPNQIITSNTNRNWDICWQEACPVCWWWKKNEKYCKDIIWFDWKNVIIAKEKTKKIYFWFWWTYSPSKCDWYNYYNWTWYSYEKIH